MSSPRKVLRGLFGPLTRRGRSFLAAGGAAVLCGLAVAEADLVRVGALLVVLPIASALLALRSRYRLACTRGLNRPRVAAGQAATVTARVENVSRLRTGVLLVLNDRLISTRPNASATRTRSGPMVNLPRLSERIW